MKFRIKLILSISIVFALFLECKKKEGPTEVFGRLTDRNNKPVPNHRINLMHKKSFAIMGRGFVARTVLTTNEEGAFYHSFHADDDSTYRLESSGSDCFFENDRDIIGGESNEINWELISKRNLNLSINKDLQGDSIYYRIANDKGEILHDSYGKLSNRYISLTHDYSFQIDSNPNITLTWDLYSSEVQTSDTAKLQISACENVTFEITK